MGNNNNGPWPRAMRQANFKAIEQDLYNFETMVEEIERAKKEVEEIAALQAAATDKEFIPGGDISDPTASKANEIWQYRREVLSGAGFIEMERRVRAIKSVLYRLDRSLIPNEAQKASLVREWYFENRLTPQGLADKFHVAYQTAYNWRNDVVREIARRLGFIV